MVKKQPMTPGLLISPSALHGLLSVLLSDSVHCAGLALVDATLLGLAKNEQGKAVSALALTSLLASACENWDKTDIMQTSFQDAPHVKLLACFFGNRFTRFVAFVVFVDPAASSNGTPTNGSCAPARRALEELKRVLDAELQRQSMKITGSPHPNSKKISGYLSGESRDQSST
jgi:hypothetical protein